MKKNIPPKKSPKSSFSISVFFSAIVLGTFLLFVFWIIPVQKKNLHKAGRVTNADVTKVGLKGHEWIVEYAFVVSGKGYTGRGRIGNEPYEGDKIEIIYMPQDPTVNEIWDSPAANKIFKRQKQVDSSVRLYPIDTNNTPVGN